ncbi:hypothetical protein Q1695_015846 [Nippostrongylus brasiliensis]|nr:hypothetical protein Q1695_015846 [Nippostrongylus brasiliensis]
MMYSNGDLEDPLSDSVEMVLDMAKFQMVKALEDAWRRVIADHRHQITLEDVMFVFRQHKFHLKRLLQFAEAAEKIRHLQRAAPRAPKLDEDVDRESDEEQDAVPSTSLPDSNLDRMRCIVERMDLKMSADELMQRPDREYERRQRRIANIVMNEMSAEEYPQFTEARTATFLDEKPKQGLKRKKTDADLMRWLGAPANCEPSVAFVLAFIGREVVATYVDAAYNIMLNEQPNLFLNDVRSGHAAIGDEPCPLQVRHYSEALRRNLGWRLHKDFLFGCSEDPDDNPLTHQQQG